MILKPEVLLIFSIQVASSHGSDLPDIVTVVDRLERSPSISRIRSNLGLLHKRRISIKLDKLMDGIL